MRRRGRDEYRDGIRYSLIATPVVMTLGATVGALVLQKDGKDGGDIEDLLGGAAVGSILGVLPLLGALMFFCLWHAHRR